MQSPFAKPLDRSFVDFFAKIGMQNCKLFWKNRNAKSIYKTVRVALSHVSPCIVSVGVCICYKCH
jgi:hypothetical protein